MKKPPEEKFLLLPEAIGLDLVKSSMNLIDSLTKNLILCYWYGSTVTPRLATSGR